MKVAVLGLGQMGWALAEALSKAPAVSSLAVWNRTPARADEFVGRHGGEAAVDPSDAVRASDVVIVCLLDYGATMEVLESDGVPEAFKGKTIIQLSNGSPSEITRLAAWAESHGVPYLDGVIMGGPSDVGKPYCGVGMSGPKESWNQYAGLLKVFGDRSDFHGPNRQANQAINAAILGVMASGLLGFINAAALSDAYGFPPEELFGICGDLAPLFKNLWKATIDKWAAGDSVPREETASADIWWHEIRHITDAASEAGVDATLYRAMASMLDRAREAGEGERDVSALIGTLKTGPAGPPDAGRQA